MSITVDYFFNGSGSLRDLAALVNNCLGCSLQPEQDNAEVYVARLLGMDLALSQALDYENDRELDFENFQYELSLKTWVGQSVLRPIQLPLMVASIYSLHCFFGTTGILVYDMDLLLARYVEREAENYGLRLYDLVSETPFVNYSDHLAILSKRLPS